MTSKIISPFIISLILFALSGCAPAPIKVYLSANNRLNIDRNNNSLPVIVRIYQLRDAQLFNTATFQQLWKDDNKTLGDTFLARRVLVINPGGRLKTVLSRRRGCRDLGVMAIFRRPVKNRWRSVMRIDSALYLLPISARIKIDNNSIIVQ